MGNGIATMTDTTAARGSAGGDGRGGGRPRLDLLATFALVSLIPITCLGLALGQYLNTQIRARILSGSTDHAEVARATAACDEMLEKPCPAKQLRATLERWFAHAKS